MKAVSRDADGRCWLRHVQPPLMKRGASVPPGQQSAADELGCFPAAQKKEKKKTARGRVFGGEKSCFNFTISTCPTSSWGGLIRGLSVG